ncbi:MAG TPA: nitrogenase cofactor biosynthesis protein NifB [Pseudobacteroides sp.]|uniref:nitrogenase cofactor biosynthesis protein NifB n=1 Tax=Pseudobacteroides sp. TaxID=1968840 RepID=UPI002F933656
MAGTNFVNLNMNPCKMCMPMGAALAFKGIENSILLLHGSQGCSTYIRRHMTGHYNEPIDIGSSSLSEEGTVYGGENNLKKGLLNIIKVYNPDIIGVATTCLAETIGEDINRIVTEFKEEEEIKNLKIVPVPTPGYGGTQFEGYFSALKAMVSGLAKNSKPNSKVNIIVSNLNPGDVRNIKEILEAFKISYTMFPDVSETLDAPYSRDYKRIPPGGTKISDIVNMPGAPASIEIGYTISKELSPGQYLLDKWGVKFYRCPLPIGIENTDLFLNILSEIKGKPVPDKILKEKGRLIDGMIDSHKFNSEGKAVIYGEPELVYALGKLCFENGIKPVLLSTGSQNKVIGQLVPPKTYEEKPVVLDDTDFDTIREKANSLKANILIGNSDGKVITEKDGIPLVRVGFPVHDRVGAQRQVITGYNGTLRLLDEITNTLIENKYNKYRRSMYDKYYKGNEAMEEAKNERLSIEEKTSTHPCFSGGCQNARMHLPVAPGCNISCNYCNRKYDCQNESRPGVTSKVLTPEEALEKFLNVRQKVQNLKVIGIAGPGDALANFDDTKKSLEMIKAVDPDITFCLSTNGLMLMYYADEIIRLGVTHVTITINAIDPKVGALVYREVNFMGVKLTGEKAAEILLANQLAGLKYLSSRGIVCKVNIVMIKGINDNHIESVVERVKEYGAFMTNIMPLIPAAGSMFENMPMTSNKELNDLRKKCNIHLKQMYHCRQCRADAIGTLDEDVSSEFMNTKCSTGCSENIKGGKKKMYTFAVATKTNIFVDQHFGQSEGFYIYKYNESGLELVEQRLIKKYCTGSEDCEHDDKIQTIIKTISDCNAVITMRIGYNPSKELEKVGIKVIQTCERIEDAVKNAAEELSKKDRMDLVV